MLPKLVVPAVMILEKIIFVTLTLFFYDTRLALPARQPHHSKQNI